MTHHYINKNGFTLAEVLITLGIIGIVAALLIPHMVSHYRRAVVGARLKQFYSTIQVATQKAEATWGDKEGWDKLVHSGSDWWFDKYLLPEMKGLVSVKVDGFGGRFVRYMTNGSAFAWDGNAITFFPFAKDIEKCNIVPGVLNDCLGKKSFQFLYHTDTGMTAFDYPHHSNSNYTYERWVQDAKERMCTKEYIHTVYGLCNRSYCTKWIQLNNWEIPSDYPFKF